MTPKEGKPGKKKDEDLSNYEKALTLTETDYYLSQRDEIYGPIDVATIASWIGEGRVTPRDWVFMPNASEWIPILEIKDLAVCFHNDAEKPAKPPAGISIKAFLNYYHALKKDPGNKQNIKIIEQRNWVRLPLYTSIKFYEHKDYDTSPEKLVGNAFDISEGGLGLQYHSPIKTDILLDLFFKLTPDPLHIFGNVVYCKKVDDGTYFVGIAFVDISDEKRLIIRNYIRTSLKNAASKIPAVWNDSPDE